MSDNLKSAIKSEYIKCANDPVYFIKKYAKIQHVTRGKILFDLWPFQEDVYNAFSQHRDNIVLKSRQLGISTLIAAYSLHKMIFCSDQNILVIATKQDTAKNLVTKVRVMYSNLPSWLKTTVVEDNKLSLKFANGSIIKATSAAADSARSEALSLLIIDEAAFIANIDEIWTAAQQTLSTGGQSIICSTPNGVGNFFHKTWISAGDSDTPFNRIFLPWQVHPEHDQAWRDAQTVILGSEKKAAQECDASFITSGQSVVDGEILEWYRKTQVVEPIEKRYAEKLLWIWSEPDIRRSYIIAADVARGDSNDYSAFHVLDIDTMEQVAEYRGKLIPQAFGNLLVTIATEYNDALLVVENASIGYATIQAILDRDYRNLYYTYRDDGYIDPSVHIPKGYDTTDKSKMVPGFTTSSKTRPLIISKLDTSFREADRPLCKSTRLIEELAVFVWNGHRAEAQRGYNDDLVMSYAIALWVRDSAIRLRTAGNALTRASLSAIHSTKTLYNGRNQDSQLKQAGWEVDINGKDEDITWLL